MLVVRALRPEDRAGALIKKGRAHRVLDDRAAEEAAFREAMDVVGASPPLGHVAAAPLGHTASKYKDPRPAAEWFLTVARQPDAVAQEGAVYRSMAANILAGAGEIARAREEYRAVLDEFAGSDEVNERGLADESRKEIEKLDAGAGAR